MAIKIGSCLQQPSGYKAFMPLFFPPEEVVILSFRAEIKHVEAMSFIGKSDGITQLIPDRVFLQMLVNKEAALQPNRRHTS